MSTDFPTSIDTFPTAEELIDDTLATNPHSTLHGNLGDAITAIENITVGPSMYNVKGYGAAGNGTTNDQTALAAAITAATATGGVVFFPPGTYLLSGTLTVPTNVILRGAGPGASTLKSTGAASNTELVRLSDNGAGVEDLTIDANSRSGSIAINVWKDDSASTILTRCFVQNCRIINSDTREACRVPRPSKDFRFQNNDVESCDGGLVLYGTTDQLHTGVIVTGNHFRSIGNTSGGETALQLYTNSGTYGSAQTFDGVVIANNRFSDFTDATTNIPIEITGCKNITVAGNVIGAATRGVSTGYCTDLVISHNVIRDQTIYGVELNGGNRITIVGNHFRNCNSLTVVSGSGRGLSDLTITGNSYIGTGRSGSTSNLFAIKLYDSDNTTDVDRVRIAENLFVDCEYQTGVIRLGASNSSVNDAVIVSNTYIATNANSPLLFIEQDETQRLTIRGNVCRITRNLAAGDDYLGFVYTSASGTTAQTLIEDNFFMFSGTVSAATNSAAINHGSVGSHVHAGVLIRNNRIQGAYRGYRLPNITSTDLRIEGNDVRGATAANLPDNVPTVVSTTTATVYDYSNTLFVSGTTTIQSIVASWGGRIVNLITTANCTFVDGSNLKLASNFVGTADDCLTLVCDGTSWYEVARSAN